jgi:pimeloyl-ACP methyl ester carboxylesterase
MKNIVRLVSAAAATLLALGSITACSASNQVDLGSYRNQDPNWAACDKDWLIEADSRSKEYASAKVDCATITAPARYDLKVGAPDYGIAMMRIKASGTRLGTLFINPGGPGGSGIEELQNTSFPQEILEAYDIVGFDPRGVKHSTFVDGTEIRCSNATDFATYWSGEMSPANDAEYIASLELQDAHVTQCVKDNPYWYTMSTANVVQDLDLMRQVLTGDEPLNFLGSSYGTTIAATYIGTFPEHVGRIVLDSPTNNAPPSVELAAVDAKAFEARLTGWINGYAKHSKMTVGEVKKLLLQWGDDDKLVGFAGTEVVSAENHTFRSNEALFLHGLQVLQYMTEQNAQDSFNQGIDELAQYKWNGTFEWLALSLDGYDPSKLQNRTNYKPSQLVRDNSFEVMMIVNEMDVNWPALTDAEEHAMNKAVSKVSPFWTKLNDDPSGYYYDGKRSAVDYVDFALKDKLIPDPPTSTPVRVNTSGKEVLVVGSRKESVTPFAFAEQTAKELKSPLLIFEGSIHAPIAHFDNECLNTAFVDYLVKGELPADGTSCKP